MNKHLRLILFTALIAMLLLPAMPIFANPDIEVDAFGDTQTVTQTGVGTNTGSVTGGMLGGERDVEVEVTGTGGGNQLVYQVNAGGSGQLAHSHGSGVLGLSTSQWDGSADGGALTVDYDGLGGEDLTNSGNDNAFVLVLIESDASVDATITVYSGDDAHCSSLTRDLPDIGVNELTRVVIFRYQDFAPACGNAASFDSVGAVVLEIDGQAAPSADVTIDLFTTGTVDYGDLPGSSPDYQNTLLANNGAGHVVGSVLYLGTLIDGEVDGQEDAQAGTGSTGGDDNNGVDDEDGVVRTSAINWSQASGGSVDVVVSGSGGSGCLNGWIDWNQDGNSWDISGMNFVWDTDEYIVQNSTTGTGTYTFDIPVAPGDECFYARFRAMPALAAGGCETLDPTFDLGLKQQYASGEVEDYYWCFGPNAITITSVTAHSGPAIWVAAALGLVGLGVVGALVIVRRRTT